MEKLIKYSGVALIIAGLFFLIANVAIAPFVNFEATYSMVLTSTIFLYRMISAALTSAFLLFGAVGLYLHHGQVEHVRLFRQITFIIAFGGSAFLFANEWHQIFVLPEIAKINPEVIDKLDASGNSSGYAIGAMLALTTFSIGWILFTISILISRKLKRIGPALVLAGFIIIPIISGILSPLWGGIIGSISLGIGLSLIGIELITKQ